MRNKKRSYEQRSFLLLLVFCYKPYIRVLFLEVHKINQVLVLRSVIVDLPFACVHSLYLFAETIDLAELFRSPVVSFNSVDDVFQFFNVLLLFHIFFWVVDAVEGCTVLSCHLLLLKFSVNLVDHRGIAMTQLRIDLIWRVAQSFWRRGDKECGASVPEHSVIQFFNTSTDTSPFKFFQQMPVALVVVWVPDGRENKTVLYLAF